MQSRDEHLKWCKERALELLKAGDLQGAVGSMVSDLQKWTGGQMYDPMLLAFLNMDGVLFCKTPEQVKRWVEGFN